MKDPNEIFFCYKNEMTEIEEEAIIEITNFSSPCHMYAVVKVEVYACSFTQLVEPALRGVQEAGRPLH